MSLHPNAHLHLEWIKRNPNFVPDIPLRDGYKSYYEDMLNFWSWNSQICPDAVPMMANRWLQDDLQLHQTYDARIREKERALKIVKKKNEWFVTINFNHQTYTIEKCVNLIKRVLAHEWVLTCTAVFEINRANGRHPHVHMIIKTDLPKSKVIYNIWRTSGIKTIVLKQAFIDVKEAIPQHQEYVTGNKQQSKMACVIADRLWRQENNIPESFVK